MSRHRKDKIKVEKPEPSPSKASQEHDLAYYIHDRVELMHQVFSVLRSKDLKLMAPECVRRLSIDDLQELCTEELLGISSKRLCAILDGAEPPSDTESSSRSPSPAFETISLDSISSDEEILSQTSEGRKRKKHKHRRRDSKSSRSSKAKRKQAREAPQAGEESASKASRAGLTVLELLELQARARAIRAQLQQDQASKKVTETTAQPSSGGETDVEIKEEQPEVVEISSDEEKPRFEELQKALQPASTSKQSDSTTKNKEKKKKKDKDKDRTKKDKNREVEIEKDTVTETQSKADTPKEKETPITSKVTKRTSDLIITVPQQPTRKIKLNRTKATVSVTNGNNAPAKVVTIDKPPEKPPPETAAAKEKGNEKDKAKEKSKEKDKVPKKDKQKKKKKVKQVTEDKDGSDADEIMLQLSDTEKMDLLEDFDRKNYDCVTSSSEDSETSSSDTSEDSSDDEKEPSKQSVKENPTKSVDSAKPNKYQGVLITDDSRRESDKNTDAIKTITAGSDRIGTKLTDEIETTSQSNEANKEKNALDTENCHSKQSDVADVERCIVVGTIADIPLQSDPVESEVESQSKSKDNSPVIHIDSDDKKSDDENVANIENSTLEDTVLVDNETTSNSPKVGDNVEVAKPVDREESEVQLTNKSQKPTELGAEQVEEKSERALSEGELSGHESSEVEAVDLQPEVVCISDEDGDKAKKKKKKKDKKAKKEKKSKKQYFREGSDQNFFREEAKNKVVQTEDGEKHKLDKDRVIIDEDDDDDVYEILELSDDSSCYEVEGTVLSKEPTAEEIEFLSAKIDEIERDEIITEEEIRQHENLAKTEDEVPTENEESAENISWKDRYLGSRKVKKVLTTSNILNALRKKNKELKKKMEESKKKEMEEALEVLKETVSVPENTELEEGTLEHFNTLEGSTKYVDPVPDPALKKAEKDAAEKAAREQVIDNIKNVEIQVTGEMKKDAKQLLKMYKKLLKYNDITKPKDPSKKKKKSKKKKDSACIEKSV